MTLNHEYAYLQAGRFSLVCWWSLSMWGLSFHTKPCCRFWCEFGPLEIAVAH